MAALIVTLLSVPFVLPIVSWVMTRRLRDRVAELEQKLDLQTSEIRELRSAVTRLSKVEKPVPETPAAAPAPPRPAPAPPAPAAVAPPPVPVVPPKPQPAPPRAEAPAARSEAPPQPEPRPTPPVAPPPLPSSAADASPRSTPPVPAQPPVSPPRPPVPPRRETARPPVPPPPPPPRPSARFDLEQFVGVKLFAGIAGIALVFAAVLFLRYSIEAGWLQPPVRVAIGVITAIALLVACERTAARKYPVTANALDAAAIAILFATFFSAHALWQLIPASVSFALLALVTATAVLLSVRHESLFIAVLGLLGGFATPVLLSTGENRPIPLFAYLLLLNVGLAWVAYKRAWPVLSLMTIILTTLYQWGWVLKFLDASPLPLALAIFIVFPLVTFGALTVARTRSDTRDQAESEAFEWPALVAAALPLLFALYLAAVPAYGARYGLLFGYLFLLDAGMLAVALAQRREIVHVGSALSTLVVFGVWLATSYPPGSWLAVAGIAAGFSLFFLAAPVLADRVRRGFDGIGTLAVYAAPTLLFVFAAVAGMEPAVASPYGLFGILVGLMVVLAWRAVATGNGAIYHIAAFCAVAAQAVWSATHLRLESLPAALALYGAFGVLSLAVPVIARRVKRPLEPRGATGLVLLASLTLLLFLTSRPLGGPALWGIGLLLAILNAAVFVESAATRMPVVSLLGGVLSWIVLFVWWTRAAGSVGLLPALLVVVGLTLIMLAGHAWAQRQQKGPAPPPLPWEVRGEFRDGLWLALVGYVFLVVVAGTPAWVLPPWPLFGALTVIALAISTTALAERSGVLHAASATAAAVVLLVALYALQAEGWAVVHLAAFGVLVLFVLAWIPIARRSGAEATAAGAAAIVITLAMFGALGSFILPNAPRLELIVGAQVVYLSLLLALTARYEWTGGATFVSGVAAIVLLGVYGKPGTWYPLLLHGSAMYVPFAVYPLLLGARARDTRDPYIASIVASAWCFLATRYGVMAAGYGWMVGAVPVVLGAVTTIHLRQLLRLQPSGARDLGRLALVAGAALAFLTVAIPLQLRQQWITIGWALEGAAVAWLYGRVPHRGLLLAAVGLLGAVFTRLALNPEVLRYEPRGSMRILNWYLYTYLACAAAMIAAAWWLSRTDDSLGPNLPRPRHLLPAAAGILLFLLLNIEIADFYASGPDLVFNFGSSIAQDLTYTIGWLVFGLALLACGIVLHSRAARIASVALVTVTTFKCFLYDLGSLGGLPRIGAFVGLAVSLALVSLALQKYVLAPGKERAS